MQPRGPFCVCELLMLKKSPPAVSCLIPQKIVPNSWMKIVQDKTETSTAVLYILLEWWIFCIQGFICFSFHCIMCCYLCSLATSVSKIIRGSGSMENKVLNLYAVDVGLYVMQQKIFFCFFPLKPNVHILIFCVLSRYQFSVFLPSLLPTIFMLELSKNRQHTLCSSLLRKSRRIQQMLPLLYLSFMEGFRRRMITALRSWVEGREASFSKALFQ